MAKHIEFTGVSGVGKSTTYNFLRSLHSNKYNWIPTEKLTVKNITYKEALKVSLKVLVSLEQHITNGQNWYLIDKFSKNNPQLVDLFWANFLSNKGTQFRKARFHSVGYILKIIEKLQRVYDHPEGKIIFVDEGFIHNLNYFTNSSTIYPYSKQVKTAIDLINLPSGVVYFKGDIEIIIERTFQREKINYRDNGLLIEELRDARMESITEKEIFINAAIAKNVPVLFLECNESVQQKSKRIMDFVNDLKLMN